MKGFKHRKDGSQLASKREVVVGGKTKPKRPVVSYIVVVLVVALLVGGAYWLHQHRHKPAVATVKSMNVCAANGMLKEASPLLPATKSADLKPVVAKILATKDYDKDPNCLYVVTMYYINVSDAKNARLYYNKFVTVYKSSDTTNPLLTTNYLSQDQLKQTVEFLEKAAAQPPHHNMRPANP